MPNKNVTLQQCINTIHHHDYSGHVSVESADSVAKKTGVIFINSDVLKPSLAATLKPNQHIQIPWSMRKTNTSDDEVCACVCVCMCALGVNGFSHYFSHPSRKIMVINDKRL